ncbi:uncharacterized protein LOC132707672 isoform X2 [Cylas formicarius]|uniref:uncharacterized protein LOC132707672 isoform X2 n=1 Tax=Cylas formicarius TaxID=197179 RepID=UPI00295872AF|nr:uncharacterized protein LOC132707672 isoform X2 [Cylas formicarius]
MGVPKFRSQMWNLTKDEKIVTCPNCITPAKTKVTFVAYKKTFLACLYLFPLIMCFLPFVTKKYRRAKHRCRACGAHLGQFEET